MLVVQNIDVYRENQKSVHKRWDRPLNIRLIGIHSIQLCDSTFFTAAVLFINQIIRFAFALLTLVLFIYKVLSNGKALDAAKERRKR